ncbi:MAG: DNA mismatch repair protein MutS, partial [Treponema sp.]|nr:DNA mismatch repair protein MutS [Treponema sp.]
MLDQYRRIKRENSGTVLFFRLGDFYEMFADDALEVSALLNLTLTSRNGLPMCGVPYHSARSYIARLLRHGKKIAVCEQMGEPGKTKLIERQVVEVITPGTTVDEDFLEQGASNYLAAAADAGKYISFSYIDLSTGEFFATSFLSGEGEQHLALELQRLEIKELVISESLLEENSRIAKLVLDNASLVVNRWARWLFDPVRGRERLMKQFGTASLKGFGLSDAAPEILAAGALLDYLDDTAKSLIPHVRSIALYGSGEYAEIDQASQRNLELVRNLQDGTEQFTLLEVLDETKTAMGRRLLRRRVLHPLRSCDPINKRLALVESFYRAQEELAAARELLGKTPDLERLCSRLAMDKAHGKDMVSIKNALLSLLRLTGKVSAGKALLPPSAPEQMNRRALIESVEAAALGQEDFSILEDLRKLLDSAVAENPSILLTEGNLIREGYSEELENLRKLKDSGRQLLEAYLEEEKKATGMPGLKIRYNRLIGYFFEINRNNLSRVPRYFIRRQGMAGGERFTTDALAKLESEINGASDKIIELERKLFLEIRKSAKEQLGRLSAASRLIAELDAAQSLARAATIRGWVKPSLDEENRLFIREGRHPVVEAHMPRGEFIPNDLTLGKGAGDIYFALITGPNMAGKSTYLRQGALMVIMAQIGSFVPASEARIGLCDRIFCRVGASDNLARGESTFLVEMNETAHILHTATEKSLVIMDEVGRGTGTGDGLAIAWAVCEDLLDRIRCRTLFATHYHELSLLSHPRLANRSMEVLERNGEIVFLRSIREGAAAQSYGIHVAGLAGISREILNRAEAMLERIREGERSIRGVL